MARKLFEPWGDGDMLGIRGFNRDIDLMEQGRCVPTSPTEGSFNTLNNLYPLESRRSIVAPNNGCASLAMSAASLDECELETPSSLGTFTTLSSSVRRLRNLVELHSEESHFND